MEIQLNQESVVDKTTGEVSKPSEFVENLREVESQIARSDDRIGELKADLKAEKDVREKLVARLRSAVRNGQVLPLLESEASDDGDQVK